MVSILRNTNRHLEQASNPSTYQDINLTVVGMILFKASARPALSSCLSFSRENNDLFYRALHLVPAGSPANHCLVCAFCTLIKLFLAPFFLSFFLSLILFLFYSFPFSTQILQLLIDLKPPENGEIEIK